MSRPSRLSCEEVFRRLDDYLDRTLSAEERRQIRAHLRVCAECAAEYRFEDTVLTEVRDKLRRIQMPPGLLERIAARLVSADPED